ncbi:hypothetical protein KSZ08_22465, partial [Phocaeicola vulgatus]|nr:hypothetical protein [Phocaeicola vulgatus]MBV4215016.1 hypothetical protein [Phocaeicola vulgatus]
NCSSIPDYTHTLDLVVALGGIPSAFSFSLPDDYPRHYQSTKFQSNEQQEEKRGSDRLFLLRSVPGKATQLCPFWPRRIIPFG